MKRILFALLIVLLLVTAIASKPDDKTCIIATVKAVWGNYMPDTSNPVYYEQFMDVTSQAVKIDDWWVVKRLRYKYGKEGFKTVGYGAFKRVFIVR